MRKGDIAQVAEIDREAFPTEWPPPNYLRELDNPLAHYVIACHKGGGLAEPELAAVTPAGFSMLAIRLRRLFRSGESCINMDSATGGERVLGFAGLWID